MNPSKGQVERWLVDGVLPITFWYTDSPRSEDALSSILHSHKCRACGKSWLHSNGLSAEECEEFLLVDCAECEGADPLYKEQEGRF